MAASFGITNPTVCPGRTRSGFCSIFAIVKKKSESVWNSIVISTNTTFIFTTANGTNYPFRNLKSHRKEDQMEITIYFEDGTRKTILHVADITWTRRSVYIDVLQTWNECPERDEPFIFKREKISQILINNIH